MRRSVTWRGSFGSSFGFVLFILCGVVRVSFPSILSILSGYVVVGRSGGSVGFRSILVWWNGRSDRVLLRGSLFLVLICPEVLGDFSWCCRRGGRSSVC